MTSSDTPMPAHSLMRDAHGLGGGEALPKKQRGYLPPVTEIAVIALALVVVGGVYLASYLPRHAPLGVPTGLLATSALLVVANAIFLARLANFAWGTFFKVLRWALLAYFIIAGMLEYVFIFDGTRGKLLVVLTGMLVVFALDVPTIIAFTVARFADLRSP